MTSKEVYTAQNLDVVKERLLCPAIADTIIESTTPNQKFTLVDFGCGDSSSINQTISLLAQANRQPSYIAYQDLDPSLLPHLTKNLLLTHPNTSQAECVTDDRFVKYQFVNLNRDTFDFATTQMVLHQIPTIPELSHFLYSAHQVLKPNGKLIIIGFHPKYLEYLQQYEPDKLKLKSQNNQLEGKYQHDDGGNQTVFFRKTEEELAIMLSLGFNLISRSSIVPQAIAHLKPRYQELTAQNIPMFYQMELIKDPNSFISSTDGTIKNIKPLAHTPWLDIEFIDGDQIQMPAFESWKTVQSGDLFQLHEVYLEKINKTVINYWFTDKKDKIHGGQLIASTV